MTVILHVIKQYETASCIQFCVYTNVGLLRKCEYREQLETNENFEQQQYYNSLFNVWTIEYMLLKVLPIGSLRKQSCFVGYFRRHLPHQTFYFQSYSAPYCACYPVSSVFIYPILLTLWPINPVKETGNQPVVFQFFLYL